MNDRLLYLTLTDSALEAAWNAYCYEKEARALYAHAEKLSDMLDESSGRSKNLINILSLELQDVLQRHSLTLHHSSEYKGQYSAFQTMRKYIARQGYKVQSF